MSAEGAMYEQTILQNQVALGKKLDAIIQGVKAMSIDLAKILDAVAKAQAEDASAVQAMTAMQQQIVSLQKQVTDLTSQLGDQAALQAQLDAAAGQLAAGTQSVTAAVAASTPPTQTTPAS